MHFSEEGKKVRKHRLYRQASMDFDLVDLLF